MRETMQPARTRANRTTTMKTNKTSKNISNPADTENVWLCTLYSAILGALFALMCFAVIGCEDDNGYELVPGNGLACSGDANIGHDCTTSDGLSGTWQCLTTGLTCVYAPGSGDPGGGGLNPGGDNPPPDDTPNPGSCKSVPSFWDLRSYQGCMTQSSLSGAYRLADRTEYWYEGKPFAENSNGAIGELWYMTSDSSECGPVMVSTVSNSGSVQLTAGADVDWYLVEPSMAELVWQKLHGSVPPSEIDVQSGEFASLLIDILDCEVVNTSCSLKASIPGGWPTYGGMVSYQHTGPNATAEGAFCGHMYIVARSR